MPRVTHVRKAQQRYATVPVLDDQGQPVKVPKMRNGVQMTTSTKRGNRPIFIRLTREDRTQPKPLLTCDYCRKPIEIGTPYKHISPKSGPYGGQQRNRHESCPTWQVWEYSSSLSAQLEKVSHDFADAVSRAGSEDDVSSALTEAAEGVRSIASEKETSAQNMEDGFGHETEQSTELRDTAEQLVAWADDIEQADVPDFPEPEEEECDQCGGTGQVEDSGECDNCDGEGRFTPDEPTDDQIAEWRSEVEQSLTIVDESPVG